MQSVLTKSEKRQVLLAVLAIIFGLSITGTMDYADAKKQESIICSRKPAPEYCQ